MTGKGGKATRGATGMLENLQINVPEYSCTRVWVGEYMLPFLLGHIIDLYLTFFFLKSAHFPKVVVTFHNHTSCVWESAVFRGLYAENYRALL